jgi:hypothetical protein
MKTFMAAFERWLEQSDIYGWARDRDDLKSIHCSIDAQKIMIAEKAFNVTFDESLNLRKKIDIYLTALVPLMLAVAIFYTLNIFMIAFGIVLVISSFRYFASLISARLAFLALFRAI